MLPPPSGHQPGRPKLFMVGIALSVAITCSAAHAVTDCSKPKSNVERLLCSNSRAALADEVMAVAFRDAFLRTENKEALVKEQEEWRKNVRDACNDVPCLLNVYRQRTTELETW